MPPYAHGPYVWDQQVTIAGNGNGEGDVWYVDGTNGNDANNGKAWTSAFALIQTAVTAAGPGDTIYITAKDLTDFTGDPTSYTENIVIPAATSNLSLIGVSRGRTQGGLPQIKVGTTTTQALLTIRAPGCLIMNLGFNGAGATGGGILLDDDYATKSAFGTSIIGCHLKNCVGTTATNAATGGAIMWTTAGNAWQVLISGNRFYKNVGDIVLMGTTNTRPQDVVIENNQFSGYAAYTDCNIYCGGSGFGSVNINNNVFGQLPALGSGTNKRYMILTGTLSGMVTNNTFGCLTANTGTTITFNAAGTGAAIPTTVHVARNYGQSNTAGESGEINIA
jgi:hypothetical protein